MSKPESGLPFVPHGFDWNRYTWERPGWALPFQMSVELISAPAPPDVPLVGERQLPPDINGCRVEKMTMGGFIPGSPVPHLFIGRNGKILDPELSWSFPFLPVQDYHTFSFFAVFQPGDLVQLYCDRTGLAGQVTVLAFLEGWMF